MSDLPKIPAEAKEIIKHKRTGKVYASKKDFDADVVLGIVHVLNKNFPHGSIRTALGAFYNHSDSPNCKNVAGFWHQLPVKYLVTTKSIRSGDELTAKYSLYKDFNDKWE